MTSDTDAQRIPSAWTEFGDGHDYSRSGKHDPGQCRWCLRRALMTREANLRSAVLAADVDRRAQSVEATDLRARIAELEAALTCALPWVAMATGENPDRHPRAIANAKEDLAIVQAALAIPNAWDGKGTDD